VRRHASGAPVATKALVHALADMGLDDDHLILPRG
jgi:hypothetical protein